MRVSIRKLGNSRGVILPKPVLAQAGLESEVELTVEEGAIVLRKPEPEIRKGWAQASRRIASEGPGDAVWPEFGNEGDAQWQW